MEFQQFIFHYAIQHIFNKNMTHAKTIEAISKLMIRFTTVTEKLDKINLLENVIKYSQFYAYWVIKLNKIPNPFDYFEKFIIDADNHDCLKLLDIREPEKKTLIMLCRSPKSESTLYDKILKNYKGSIVNENTAPNSKQKLKQYIYDIETYMYNNSDIIVLNQTNHKKNVRKEVYRIAENYDVHIWDFSMRTEEFESITEDEKENKKYIKMENGEDCTHLIIENFKSHTSDIKTEVKELKKYGISTYIGVEICNPQILLTHPVVEKIIKDNPDIIVQESFHVTIEYFGHKPCFIKKNKYNDLIDKEVKITCLGIAHDEFGIAILVDNTNIPCENEYAHITIGNVAIMSPSYSNTLIKNTILTTYKKFDKEFIVEGKICMKN